MATFVLSDLHLDERANARLFKDERQGKRLASLFEELAAERNARLVLLGDTFDFTSMLPPERGLERFADALEFPLEVMPCRNLAALLEAVERSNPLAFEALRKVSRAIPVTVVVGNHDWQLGLPDAIDRLRGAGLQVELAGDLSFELAGSRVALEHGHRFDPSNAHPHGGGEVLTRALYQAVIPFLRHHGARSNVRMEPDRVVALRPQERALELLERWLDPTTFGRLLRAFLRLLAANRDLPRAAQSLIAHAPVSLVRSKLAATEQAWKHAAHTAVKALQRTRHTRQLETDADVVVLGHTHVLDWAVTDVRGRERLYVNLGTWTERAADGLSPTDTSLPLLVLDDLDGLHVELRDLDWDGGVLEVFSARRGASEKPELRI
jgi:UDP-2,3-diacylglucosamine pyrophosphatase LpxH